MTTIEQHGPHATLINVFTSNPSGHPPSPRCSATRPMR
jgi:hypothetical protein